MIWYILLGLFTLAGLYFGFLIYAAKNDVNTAPRTAMLICEKHGPFPAKAAIEFNFGGMLETPVAYCPICYHEKFKEAKLKMQ